MLVRIKDESIEAPAYPFYVFMTELITGAWPSFSPSPRAGKKAWMKTSMAGNGAAHAHQSAAFFVWNGESKRRILPRRWIVTERRRGREFEHSYAGEAAELREAVDHLLCHAIQSSTASYASLLRLCGNAKALSQGRRVHACIIWRGLHQGTFLCNLLVQMYAQCGSLQEARDVFDRTPRRNVFSWTIIICAYIRHGFAEEALQLFHDMTLLGVKPNKVTFISVLSVYASQGSLDDGRRIHSLIVESGCESDVVVGTALLNMYSKCGGLEDARSLFDQMPARDVVSWNAMIAGYALHQQGKEALQLFHQMQSGGVVPNQVTLLSVLDACGSVADLAEGKRIHAEIVARGFDSDVVMGNAVIDMYAKCGSIEDARRTFDRMCRRNVVSWTSLIAAYAQHGQEKDALQLFDEMLLNGMIPDGVCFVSVLSACSHVGMVDKGFRYFVSMSRDYDIVPSVEHYNCMIDLIGRAGLLDEAEDLISSMKLEPSAATWTSLLFNYKMHCDVRRGRLAANALFETDPKNASSYIALSNTYAAAGMWKDAAEVRKTIDDKRSKRLRGCCSIEVNE